MKTIDIIRRAGRSLRQAKARTLLTSLAIAVGAFTLTLSLAAGEGSRQYADNLISSNVDPQTVIIAKDKALFGEGAGPHSGLKEYDADATNQQGMTFKRLNEKDLDKLRANKDLESVQPSYEVSAQYISFEGHNKKYTSTVSMYDSGVKSDTAAGSLPNLGTQIGDGDIVVPEAYAKILGMKNPNDLIGKKVTLHLAKTNTALTEADISQTLATEGQAGLVKLTQGETKDSEYTVRAISKQSATSLTTSAALLISDNQAKSLSEFMTKGTDDYQKYVVVTARAKKNVVPEDIKKDLTHQGYAAQTAKDLQNLLFTIVNILQGIVIGFGILALIASIFGIINTQYISVLERTQQIGLMKALGMHGKDVAKLFRYEAAWIGFLGGVIGSVLAWAGGTALNPWITKQLSLGDGNYLLVFQILPVVGLIVGLMLIAVIAGYFPARKAAKLDPIEALRTE